MQQYPHHYAVSAMAQPEGNVTVSSAGLPALSSAPPAEFGGPGDQWSPETFLVAAVADCFVLSFRAIARASKLAWEDLDCQVVGVLDKSDGVTRFTRLVLRVRLILAPDSDADKARRLLTKAEQACLITNSLLAKPELVSEIEFGAAKA